MIKVLNVPSLYSSLYAAVDYCKKFPNERIEIVVPDKLSLFMEKFLFEQMNISASFLIKVSTLNRFAKKNCVVGVDKQISKIGSILLIHKILNENIEKFQIFNSKAYSFSYAENIFRTIGQLKASKITFEEMIKFSSSDEQLNKKIADLTLIYQMYEQNKAGLLDASDMFLMSAFNVVDGRENSKILFVGFDDFTALEYNIIERLSLVCDVNVFNYANNSTNKYIYNSEVFSQLKNIAYINEINFIVEDVETNNTNLKNFLNSNLFATAENHFVLDDEVVKVMSLKNVKEEIEEVVRDIRLKILNGEQFKNFGVAIYNLESYEDIVKEIFAKYEINYYLDSEISINKSIFYKFLLSILKYNLDGYQIVSLIDLINSPFFQASDNEKFNLINRLISINFSGIVKEDFVLQDFDEVIVAKFKTFASFITINKNILAIEFVEIVKSLCDVFDMQNTIFNIAEKEINAQNKIVLTKSYNAILELLDEIIRFNNGIGLEDLYDIFLHVSSVLKINNLPLTLDAVKVVDASNTMEIFNNLYIVNCTAENAPALKFDCGIILDSEIDKLNFAHKLNPTISHINRLSRLRLFNSVGMFERQLVITYSKNASDIIKELLNKLKVNVGGKELNLVPMSNINFGNYKALSEMDYISYICKNNKENKKILKNYVKNKEFNRISENNLNIYDNFNSVSASTLENYFKCPFYMFLNNIIKIKPREENDIMSYDIGNMLHEIMYVYYKRNKKVGNIYEFCRDQVFKYIDRNDRLKLNMDSPILINLIDEAVRVINGVNFLDENSTFVPISFEHEFANSSAIKLKNVDIIGKVDRIDESGDMLRIIDYKSGKAEASLKELYYGYKLQLFLYSKAIENEKKKKVVGGFYLPLHNKYTREMDNPYALKGFLVNEDFVISAMDKNLQPEEKSNIVKMRLKKDGLAYGMPQNEQMENLKNYSVSVSEKAVDEIRSGYIKPSPTDIGDVCDYCAYSKVCLKKCSNVANRKVKYVSLESFKEVKHE